jgi:hypothetical protein
MVVGFGVSCATASDVGSPSGEAAASAATSAVPAEVGAWLAVIDTAADPADLAGGRELILATLGDALEGSVVVSPAGCFEGLPATIDQGAYVLAIQEGERAYVRALADQLDGDPMFEGAVTVTCID